LITQAVGLTLSAPCGRIMAVSSRESPVPQGTYYEVLGVKNTAAFDEVRQAYKALSLKHHPDKNPDCAQEATDAFQRIAESYSVLRDSGKRVAYDSTLLDHDVTIVGMKGVPPSSTFSAKVAKDLFQEIFGDALLQQVAKVYESPKRGQKRSCESEQTPSPQGACFRCGADGHFAKECPNMSAFDENVSNPVCRCGLPSKRRTVIKPGPNQGRTFLNCPIQSCRFFHWTALH